jgi:hypothetical protein
MDKQIIKFYRNSILEFKDTRITNTLFGIPCPKYPIINAIILVGLATLWSATFDFLFVIPIIILAISYYILRTSIIRREILIQCISFEKIVQKENNPDWNNHDRSALIYEIVNNIFSKNNNCIIMNIKIVLYLLTYIVYGFLISTL